MGGSIVTHRWLPPEQVSPLKEEVCSLFSVFPGRSIFFFFSQKKTHLQLSFGAADFISLFIIHYSYELYFRSSRPSYIPAKDTFSSLCAAMCDENEN